MSFLLDTDICSAHLRNVGVVHQRFIQHMGRLFVSTVTVAELYAWTYRARSRPGHREALIQLHGGVIVLDLTQNESRSFGQLRAALLDQGISVPTMDLFIAATALEHDLTLVTHNVKDYRHIPGLVVEDWLEGLKA